MELRCGAVKLTYHVELRCGAVSVQRMSNKVTVKRYIFEIVPFRNHHEIDNGCVSTLPITRMHIRKITVSLSK